MTRAKTRTKADSKEREVATAAMGSENPNLKESTQKRMDDFKQTAGNQVRTSGKPKGRAAECVDVQPRVVRVMKKGEALPPKPVS